MGTEAQPSESMGRRRALLTDSERRRIAADPEPNSDEENYRYQSISRVRNKIEDELPKDVEILEEHHEGLLEEFRSVVCADSVEDVDADDLRGRLQDAHEDADLAQTRAANLEEDLEDKQALLEDCRERLEQTEANQAEVPIGQIEERLSDAQQTLSRFRESSDEFTGPIEDAEGEIGRVLEVLSDHE